MQEIIEKLEHYNVGFELRRIGGTQYGLWSLPANDVMSKHAVWIRRQNGKERRLEIRKRNVHPKEGQWRAQYTRSPDSQTSIWSKESSFLGKTPKEALSRLLEDYEKNVLPIHRLYAEVWALQEKGETDLMIDFAEEKVKKANCNEAGKEC